MSARLSPARVRIRTRPNEVVAPRIKPEVVSGSGAPVELCRVCCSGPIEVLFATSRHLFRRCTRCQSILLQGPQVSKAPDPSGKRALASMALHEGEQRRRYLAHAIRLQEIIGSLSHRHVLDVECGSGVFLDILDWFFAAGGAGMSEDKIVSTVAGGKRRAVFHGDLLKTPPPERSYDLVTFFGALELAEQPGEQLCAAWRTLEPGGTVIVSGRNGFGLSARANGRRWIGYLAPGEARTYLSPQGLRILLERSGYSDVRILTLSNRQWEFPFPELWNVLTSFRRVANARLPWVNALAQKCLDLAAGLGWGEVLVGIGRRPVALPASARANGSSRPVPRRELLGTLTPTNTAVGSVIAPASQAVPSQAPPSQAASTPAKPGSRPAGPVRFSQILGGAAPPPVIAQPAEPIPTPPPELPQDPALLAAEEHDDAELLLDDARLAPEVAELLEAAAGEAPISTLTEHAVDVTAVSAEPSPLPPEAQDETSAQSLDATEATDSDEAELELPLPDELPDGDSLEDECDEQDDDPDAPPKEG